MRLVEQPLRRHRVLHDDRLANLGELHLLLTREIARRIDDDRHARAGVHRAHLSDQLGARNVGQPEIDDDAVEALLQKRFQRLRSATHGGHGDLTALDRAEPSH